MKNLKKIILMFAVVAGLALGISAQNDDQRRPPKQRPPVIDPKEKPPREKPPKGDDRPKKPGMSFYMMSSKRESNLG
jgi:hypothetical protein